MCDRTIPPVEAIAEAGAEVTPLVLAYDMLAKLRDRLEQAEGVVSDQELDQIEVVLDEIEPAAYTQYLECMLAKVAQEAIEATEKATEWMRRCGEARLTAFGYLNTIRTIGSLAQITDCGGQRLAYFKAHDLDAVIRRATETIHPHTATK